MITSNISELQSPPLFYKLKDFIGKPNCYVKLEGFNIAGSIKLKAAKRMVQMLRKSQKIKKNSVLICSSSGNLGIALSIICKEKGYPLICVSDPNISPISERYIKVWGGQLIKVEQRDENGGFLASRIRLIQSMLAQNQNYVFINQYEDEENILAHYHTTGREILRNFKRVDYLFIGAGTTGTLNGCAKLFKRYSPKTVVIAVDAVGSITFDKPSAKRYIPGLGTSLKPKLAVSTEHIDHIMWIKETDTIQRCYQLLEKYGLFLGGSSGTVLEAVYQYKPHIPLNSTVVAISPDNGDRYLDTVYNEAWVKEKFNIKMVGKNER